MANKNVKHIGTLLNLNKKLDKEVYDILQNLIFDNQASFIRKAILYYHNHEKAIEGNIRGTGAVAPIPQSSDVDRLAEMVESLSRQVSSLSSQIDGQTNNSKREVKEEDKASAPLPKRKTEKPKQKQEKKEKEEPPVEKVNEDEISINTETKVTNGHYDDFLAGFFESDD